MFDIALFAKELVEQTSKEAQELAKVLLDEFGIEVPKEYPQTIGDSKHFNSKAKKKKTKKYPRK